MAFGHLGALGKPFDIEPDGREAIQLSAALWIGAALFVLAGSVLAGHIQSLGEYLSVLTGLTSAIVIAFALYLALRTVAGRPRWLAYLVMAIATPGAAIAQVAADLGGYAIIAQLFPAVRLPNHDISSLLILAFVNFCLYASNLTLLWITSANRANQTQARKLAQARADLLASELQALRLKLNPHFMFNSLSASVALLQGGRIEEGVAMLYRLSTLLRTSFEVGTEDVTLDEEVSIVRDYLAIEQVRFPRQLKFEIDVSPAAGEVLIPSFLLQPLVENAVKYGVAASTTPVEITISATCRGGALHIVVENAGTDPVRNVAGGAGVGHSATRSRLAIKYGPKASFRAGPTSTGYRCEIGIPLATVAV